MLDLAFLALLGLWSAVVGLRLVDRLGPAPKDPADALALAVPVGLGTLALATLGLAEFGVLNRMGMAVVFAVGALLGIPGIWNLEWKKASRGLDRSIIGVAFDLAQATTLLGTLLTALTPVTDGDSLCYHLQVPKVFLAQGSAAFDPDLHETIYPLTTEMLYAVALAWRGPVSARLVQWLLGLAFAANVTALARPVLGARARWAGTIALLVPAVSNGMGAPLNDVALAAFGNAALFAWIRAREQSSLRAHVLAGLLAGLAIGVKYPALVWVGVLGVAGMSPDYRYQIPDRKWRQKAIGQALIFGATAVLVGGCWYLRAYWHTGNPVFPFFRRTFGGAGIDDVLDPIKRPLAVKAWNLATALVPMTLQPDRFDSFSHQFGPAFLLFLPGLILSRPPRRVVAIVATGLAFLTICLCVRQSMRFVLIAVGPMAVGVAWLAASWTERKSVPGRLLPGILALILGFEASMALARARHGLNVIAGRESSESYLTRREPTFRVGRWVDEHLPATARLVGQDHRGFYIPRAYTMELAHRRRTGLGTRGESAGEVVSGLQRQGFTHVLLCPPMPETAVEFDPTLGRLLAPRLAGSRPLYREEIGDPDGVVRRYALYDLADLASEGQVRR